MKVRAPCKTGAETELVADNTMSGSKNVGGLTLLRSRTVVGDGTNVRGAIAAIAEEACWSGNALELMAAHGCALRTASERDRLCSLKGADQHVSFACRIIGGID